MYGRCIVLLWLIIKFPVLYYLIKSKTSGASTSFWMLLLLTLTIKKTYNTNTHINFTVFNISINLHFLNFLKNNTPIFYTGLTLGQCFLYHAQKWLYVLCQTTPVGIWVCCPVYLEVTAGTQGSEFTTGWEHVCERRPERRTSRSARSVITCFELTQILCSL